MSDISLLKYSICRDARKGLLCRSRLAIGVLFAFKVGECYLWALL